MNDTQRNRIRSMRNENKSYGEIARLLSIKESTIKTFCRRNGLNGHRADVPVISDYRCKNCGIFVKQTPGRKEKKFCSSYCRNTWWNAHLYQVNRKAFYSIVCSGCGNVFQSYGNKNRKYCSHECYIADRFGAVHNVNP